MTSSFSKLSVLGPLSSPKTKVFAQLCHVVTRDSKRVALRCPAHPGNSSGFVSHHTPTHCHVFREFLQKILRLFTGTYSQHVVHMHTNANVQFRVRKQTRIACQRLGDVRRPSMALRTFLSFRLPSIRIFGFQPSGGCACNCSPSRTSALRKARV